MLKALCTLVLSAIVIACTAQSVDKDKLLDLYQSQKYDEAADYLITVYPEGTRDIKTLFTIANLKFMAGNTNVSERYYQQVYNLEPTNIGVLFNLAKIGVKRGNYSNASKYLQAILAVDSNNFNAYKQLTTVTLGQLDFTTEMKYLYKANTMRPDDGDVAVALAENYVAVKDPAKAALVLQKAIDADSANLVLLKAKLPVDLELKRYDAVARLGEQLLTDGDSSTFVLQNLGRAYYQLRKYENALKILKSIDKDLATEATHYYITLCYRQLKDYKNAIVAAQATLEQAISPNVSMYYHLLGSLNESNRTTANAIKAYKKGLQFNGHEPILYNMGILYDSQKNKAEARKYFTQYLNSNVDKNRYRDEIAYVREWLR